MRTAHNKLLEFIKNLYPGQEYIPLHAPIFKGNEKKYLLECIDSTFVSYVGKYVTQFEEMTAGYTGAKYAVAVVSGTVALKVALQLAGVGRNDEVVTQALTFVATANAISHCGAMPVFVDVDKETLGMSPRALKAWLEQNVVVKSIDGELQSVNVTTGRRVAGIVPMHTFGHPCRIVDIIDIANDFSIPVIEDSAESLGSFYNGQHTGTFGVAGIISYNGNKSITSGGGGMIITNNEVLARRARHITTTAKVPHEWEFSHDEVGYNYRMTNINAAVGLAQLEQFPQIREFKRKIASAYAEYFNSLDQAKTNKLSKQSVFHFIQEPQNSKSNYWLNSVLLSSRSEREAFLTYTNQNGVMTRPVWELMNSLPMFRNAQCGDLSNSEWVADRLVNLPSGVSESLS